MKRHLLVAAALPVLFTAATLSAVAWNRSRPVGPMDLTEREAWLSLRLGDDTRRTMSLQWQDDELRQGMTCARVAAAGFECDRAPTDPGAPEYFRRLSRRTAYVALELGGAAFESHVRAAERRNADVGNDPSRRWERVDIEALRATGSRLVLVDFSRDAETLRQRYPDGRRHLILPAILRLRVSERNAAPPELAADFDVWLARGVHIPSELADKVPSAYDPSNRGRTPFRIQLMNGRRFEPWIADISR